MRIGVLGGSGNVGRVVVRQLLSHGADVVQEVVLANRRLIQDGVLPQGDPRLVQRTVDMSSGATLERACAPLLRGVDVVISTMGIGSGKGSAELFRRVEVELPSAFARAAKSQGVGRAVLLTGVGANINSTSSWMVGGVADGQFFHLKGLVEKNFSDLCFPGGLAIFRPAGLLGTNHTSPALDWLLPKLDWMAPTRFRCIHVEQLGFAMASSAVNPTSPIASRGGPGSGGTIFEGERLFELSNGPRWKG